MKRHYPLHIHISTLFVLLILLIAGVVAGLAYQLSRNMLEATAEGLTERISREKLVELQRVLEPAEMAVNLLTHDELSTAGSLKARRLRLALLTEALENSTALTSVYLGYGNGDFFLVRRLGTETEAQAFSAPAGTRYVVQSIERQVTPPRGRYIFLDKALNPLREDDKPGYPAGYDPRQRGWYKDAGKATGQIKTPPYLFFSDRKVGMTLAARTSQGNAVVGADIRLETLGTSLARQKVTPNTHMVLTDPAGLVIAHEDPAKLATIPTDAKSTPRLTRMQELGAPVLSRLAEPAGYVREQRPYAGRLAMADGEWRVTIHPLLLEGAQPMYLVMAIPDRELLEAAIRQRTTTMIATLVILLLAVPLGWTMARAISRALRELAGEAEAIRRFEFLKPIEVKTGIKEVHQLARTMDGMKRTIHHFLDISGAIAGEEHFSRLLPMLLTETLATAEADAGILYLADASTLTPSAALRKDGSPLPTQPAPCALKDSGPLVAEAIRSGKAASGPLGEADASPLGLAPLMEEHLLEHGVAVPLLTRQHQLAGILLLLNRSPIEDARVSFIKALSGSAAISLETRSLIQAQKELFHAFIQVIATAIDAKSPYTGGHCARVPELTLMLAKAAEAEATGPFKDFRLTEGEREALHVAAWLHDCGKVTVPEYVVDKATKLETLSDRIHEIRMRFEVLKRDAEIACLKAVAAGADEAEARRKLQAEWARLDEDYAFVAASNRGGERMAPEAMERLAEIAGRTWLRTLDDRLGISQEEAQRKARTPPAPLPAPEPLLADKPEHLIERRPEDRMAPDNAWGFRMTEPELLYNRGELYNLTVAHGTLTEEERYRIDGHIVQTLIMLSRLPFPRHLRQVPEIAGGHHEKMDGSGYPKRLKGTEMSLMARMIAVADIFEALTAEDRPYKPAKKLSEAIGIMADMAAHGHIDPDLFALFLRSGVHRDYARRFMRPEHVDEAAVQAG